MMQHALVYEESPARITFEAAGWAPEESIQTAAAMVLRNPYWSSRPIARDAIRGLIARAWAGVAPETD